MGYLKMNQTMPFGEILEAIDNLSPDEQETLLNIVQRRIAALGRKRLVSEIQEARREFAEGQCKPTTVTDLMKEILS